MIQLLFLCSALQYATAQVYLLLVFHTLHRAPFLSACLHVPRCFCFDIELFLVRILDTLNLISAE